MGVVGPRGIAGILLCLGAAAWFWAEQPDLVRVAPADFECWHAGLNIQPGLYEDRPDLLPFAAGAAPFETFVATVTRDRTEAVAGAEWAVVFDSVFGAAGKWSEDLPSGLAKRVAERESAHVAALFWRADEAPFAAFAVLPEPGDHVYVRRADAPETEMLQILRVPVGTGSGPVTGCRWNYATWTVPDLFVHPWRGWMPWLALAAVLAIVWPGILQAAAGLRDAPTRYPGLFNGRKTSARAAIGVAAVIAAGLAAAVAVQGDDVAPPLIFVGGFALLSAIITALVLGRSAMRMDRVLAGEGVIARWHYDALEWPECVHLAIGEEMAAKWGLLGLMGVIMLVVGGGFVAVMQDVPSLVALGVLAAIFLICLLFLVVLPRRRRGNLLSRPGVVLVARTGIVFGGEVHDFRGFSTRLDGAEVRRAKGRDLLAVTYSAWARYGRQRHTVMIPAPRGRESEIRKVADQLNAG